MATEPVDPQDEVVVWTPGARCGFQRTDDDGTVTFHCKRTDTEIVWMPDGGHVTLCSQHRSWASALGRP